METIDSLSEKLQEGNRMFNVLQSVMILLLIICRLDALLMNDSNFFLKSLDYKHYKVLFQGLCVIPDWKGAKTWPDFMSVQELFNSNTTKGDIAYVLRNMQMLTKTSKFIQIVPEVLFSFPILHFANNTWEPFKDATELLSIDVTFTRSFNYFKEVTAKW